MRAHEIKSDKQANHELGRELSELRGSMMDAAERYELPSRFEAVPDHDSPSITITDLTTGRKTSVPLFAYGSVRQALNELFKT